MSSTLFYFLLLCLQVRSSSSDDRTPFYGVLGGDITAICPFHSPGAWRTFCRDTCEGGDVLVKTRQKSAHCERYRVDYVHIPSQTFSTLRVSLSGLTQSDSGLYRCGLGNSPSSASFQEFRLVVTDALLDGNKVHHIYKTAGSSLTVTCSFSDAGTTKSFCRGECEGNRILVQTDGVKGQGGRYSIKYNKVKTGVVVLVSMDQLTRSDSGVYRCLLDHRYRNFTVTITDGVEPSTSSPTTTKSFSSTSGGVKPSTSCGTLEPSGEHPHEEPPKSSSIQTVLLIVGVTITVVLLAAALLVSCRRRPRGDLRTSETENNKISQGASYVNPFFEDPDYQNLSPATRNQNHIYATIRDPAGPPESDLDSGSKPQTDTGA